MPTLDVSAVIEALGSQTVSAIRLDPQTYDPAGMASGGGVALTETVRGSLQPATGKDLRSLPDGESTTEGLWFFTRTELRNRVGQNPPDRIGIIGRGSYRVAKVEDWMATGGYYKCLLVKEP